MLNFKAISEMILIDILAYKKSGKDWQNILNEFHMQGFTHRTREHIKSLYSKVNLFGPSTNFYL
jgi:hypothetical protein